MEIRRSGGPGSALAVLCAVLLGASSWPVPAQSRAGPAHARTIDFDKGAIRPTPAQSAAIRRATAGDLGGVRHADAPLYSVAQADLDDDGRPDLLIQYTDASGYCGSTGCSGIILMATPGGYAATGIGLPNFGTLALLPPEHDGMHDLQFNGDSPVWRWDGRQYGIARADMPGADAPAWQTRQAAGRTLAMVVPIDSGIKTISVFCDRGRPVLAMLAKAPQPRAPLTLAFGFRGWLVNVPMAPGNGDGTLWLADLSGSDLPQWLAHRGSTATTRKLAALATESFLRINGVLQGEIALQDSTAATQAALASCYRY